jgi:hypothetical protein
MRIFWELWYIERQPGRKLYKKIAKEPLKRELGFYGWLNAYVIF